MGFSIGWIGNAEEQKLCSDIAQMSGGNENEVYAGRWSLIDTVREMRSSRLVVANDSGAIHLAALAATPVVAVLVPRCLPKVFVLGCKRLPSCRRMFHVGLAAPMAIVFVRKEPTSAC